MSAYGLRADVCETLALFLYFPETMYYNGNEFGIVIPEYWKTSEGLKNLDKRLTTEKSHEDGRRSGRRVKKIV